MIEPGDTVTINGGRIHWIVRAIESRIEPLGVQLISGLTGVRRRESFSNLVLFKKRAQTNSSQSTAKENR